MVLNDTYQEAYEILSYMDKLTVMKIPENILLNIKENRNKNFKTRIEKNDIFNLDNISKETVDLLCFLDYKYCMNEKKKQEVDNLIKNINKENEKKKSEKYNPNNLFIDSKLDTLKQEEINPLVEQNALIEIKEKNFIQKIFEKIRKKLWNK